MQARSTYHIALLNKIIRSTLTLCLLWLMLLPGETIQARTTIAAFQAYKPAGLVLTAPVESSALPLEPASLDLSVTIDAYGFTSPGSSLVYHLDVANLGSALAENVVVTDTLPAGVSYSGSSSGVAPANPAPGVYAWHLGSLITNTTFTFNITVTVGGSLPFGTVLLNQVQVSTTTPEINPANNSAGHSSLVVVPIHELQGAAHRSQAEGLAVQYTAGIVTALRSNGFYLQDPVPDADENTSEAMFIYTDSPPGSVVGDEVLVSGTVHEYRSGGLSSSNLTLTELVSPTVVLLSSGSPLPAAVTIGAGGRVPPAQTIEDDSNGDIELTGVFDPAQDGIDFYESLECMLVQVNDAIAVGPTNSFGEIPVVGDGGQHGGLLTPRGGIAIQPGDLNPERMLLDDAIITKEPKVNTGAAFNSPVVGILDYSFGNFKLLNTAVLSVTSHALAREITSLGRTADQLSVATFNLQNLDPNPHDGDNDSARFVGLAGQIVNHLNAPDLLAVQEIQDNSGATDDGIVAADQTYQALIDAISAAGGPTYQYRDIAPLDGQDGGQPGANIRVGLLFRSDRGLQFIDRPGAVASTPVTASLGASGVELNYSPGRVDPINPAFIDSRKPLAAEFSFNGRKLIVIANHLKSKSGDDPLFGRFQPPNRATDAQRLSQAAALNAFARHILSLDPHANLIVLGDMNDFQFSAPLAALAKGELSILANSLPAEERYTYVFDGNSQALDQIVVSEALAGTAAYDIVHVNAEFIEAQRFSDHDPALARFSFPPTDIQMDKTVTPGSDVIPGSLLTYTLTLSSSAGNTAYGLAMTDTLPGEIDFGGWVQNAGAALISGTIAWHGDLAPGVALNFVFTATLHADPALLGKVIVNTARFSAGSGWSGSASASFAVHPAPRIWLPSLFGS